MITFLVWEDYAENARILDNRRLGKQRVEASQIIRILERLQSGEKKGEIPWSKHPIIKCWEGYLPSLKQYYNAVVSEWVRRGFRNNMPLYPLEDCASKPPWVFNEKVCYAMYAQLILKDFAQYNPSHLKDKVSTPLYTFLTALPKEYLSFGYIWPSKHSLEQIKTTSLYALEEIAEPFVVRTFCQYCSNKAKKEGRCGVHLRSKPVSEPALLCLASYLNGKPCRYKRKQGAYCLLHYSKYVETPPPRSQSPLRTTGSHAEPDPPRDASCPSSSL